MEGCDRHVRDHRQFDRDHGRAIPNSTRRPVQARANEHDPEGKAAAFSADRSPGTAGRPDLSVVTLQPPPRTWLGRASKFDPAPLRTGTVERGRLLRRFAAAAEAPIILISASAGYGKSTLARQWCERSQRPVAWINLDRPTTIRSCFSTRSHTRSTGSIRSHRSCSPSSAPDARISRFRPARDHARARPSVSRSS